MLSFNKVTKVIHQGQLFTSLYTEYEGHIIYFDQSLPTLAVASIVCFDFSRPAIIISADFFDLTPATQNFILNHEIGHIVNGDVVSTTEEVHGTSARFLEAINKYNEERLKSVDERELKADLYATEKLGRGIALYALNELKEVMTKNTELIQKLNIDESVKITTKQSLEPALKELDARMEFIRNARSEVIEESR